LEKSEHRTGYYYQLMNEGKITMDEQSLKERIEAIESKRESLLRLLEKPDLGTLRIDVNQAIEEMDDLIEEFKRTFPDSASQN
jgi:hypothetical protein